MRDSPVAASTGNFASLISDIATQVEGIMARSSGGAATTRDFGAMYSQMLVGMVALTGQWWLDAQSPSKDEVAAHMVNLAWNGLSGLEHEPRLMTAAVPGARARARAERRPRTGAPRRDERRGRIGSGASAEKGVSEQARLKILGVEFLDRIRG